MHKARLLVVEDQPAMAQMVGACVRQIGHEVVGITGRGEDAITLTEQLRPDLVLMDIALTGACDGIAAASIIRERWGVRSLFVTGEGKFEVVERARRADPVGYLIKPFVEFELQATLETALQRQATEARLTESNSQLAEANRRLTVAVAREHELALAAEAASQARAAFLAGMSHDLRTPLNSINGAAANLVAAPGGPEVEQMAQLILGSGQHLHNLVERILDFAGLHSGQLQLESRPFELFGVISRAVRAAHEAVRGKAVRVTSWLAPTLPARIIGDALRLEQILLNLLQNAAQSTASGRIHLSVTAGGRLSFTVLDTGCGLEPAARDALFLPFAPTGRAEGGANGGVALGLASGRALARRMGGDITVRSRSGRGAAFRLSVPVQGVEGDGLLHSLRPQAVPGRRLLLVSPERRVQRQVAAAATAWGLQSAVAASLPSGAREAEGVDFALVATEAGVGREAGGLAGATWRVIRLEREGTRESGTGVRMDGPLDLGALARALERLAGRAVAPEEAARPKPEAAPSRKLGEKLPLRILAADDIRTNREVLRRMLTLLGYGVEMAENGAEVLAALERRTFDLVLLDIKMPVMDGYATVSGIIRRFPDAAARPKLVAITAQALQGDREVALKRGFDEFLTKPVLPAQLEACFLRLFQPADESPARPGPAPAESPLIDRVHLAAAFPGLAGAELAEVLREMHRSVVGDFGQVWPGVVAACAGRDQGRLAELVHGLKGCFRMVGWARVAVLCTKALNQARRGEFTAWLTFPEELRQLFAETDAAMSRLLAAREMPDELSANSPAPTGGISNLASRP